MQAQQMARIAESSNRRALSNSIAEGMRRQARSLRGVRAWSSLP
jgi:hypothetical protein